MQAGSSTSHQLEELKKEADNLGIIRKERDLPRR
jgi:hypothetical protein